MTNQSYIAYIHGTPMTEQVQSLINNSLQKRLLLAMARVRLNNTKSRRRLVLPTVKSRRLLSEKALLVILYYRRDRR